MDYSAPKTTESAKPVMVAALLIVLAMIAVMYLDYRYNFWDKTEAIKARQRDMAYEQAEKSLLENCMLVKAEEAREATKGDPSAIKAEDFRAACQRPKESPWVALLNFVLTGGLVVVVLGGLFWMVLLFAPRPG